MNMNDIIERLWADPDDASDELSAALAANPQLRAEQQAARAFNAKLKSGLQAVNADAALRQRLLQLPDLEANMVVADVSVAPPVMASNDSVWRRALPVAACLLIILGLVLYFRPDLNLELEKELFAHVYAEEFLFSNQANQIPLPEVNARMDEVVGAHLLTTADTKNLKVTFAKDCWIAKVKAMHMIIKGKTGPVTMIMMPSSVASSEFNIADERLRGVVTPTSGGTLVVIGNKQEPIEEYRKLMSTNLDWEY